MFSPEIINYLTILLGIVFFYLFKLSNSQLANIFNLIDEPKKNKIHKNATPLTASFSIFFIFIVCHILYFIFQKFNYDILLIFLSGIFGFSVGIIDDKKDLGYSKKFLSFIIFVILVLNFSENLILKTLYFETFDKFFNLNVLEANLVTLLCILLLINATNLSDGINGLCLGILTIWLLYINFKYPIYLNLSAIIIVSIFCFFYILKGFYFLGNSGSHFLGVFVSMLIIYTYNLQLSNNLSINILSVEEIFIFLMLPGLDMLRLFIVRISNKKNPFSSDLNHLHHLLIKKFSLLTSLLIYFLSIIIPILIYNLNVTEAYIIIIVFLIYYITIIFKLQKIS